MTTWTTADKLEAEADFRRVGATTHAHEMALMAVTCRDQIARLESETPRRRLLTAGRIPARNAR